MESMERNKPGPKARAIAQHLLTSEASSRNPGDANVAPAFRVAEKLRRPLSTLVGATGFRALLTRAVTLARAQAPGLDALQVKPDGSLDGLSEISNGQASQAGAAVIAEILGLLGIFIGEELTIRLLADVWPDLPAFETESHGESQSDPTIR
jgi:hypothetical protein